VTSAGVNARGLRRAVARLLVASAAAASPATLAAQSDSSPPPHTPTSYTITIVTSDTGSHLLGEVETGWRLQSVQPVEMILDSAFRVIRVLVDGKPNTRLSRTMYARQGVEVVVPHEKAPGDTLTTRVRYHGIPRGGFRVGPDRTGARALAGETAAGRAPLWLPVPEGDGSSRARVTWNVQASEGQRVVANGRLVKVDTLAYGNSTWHYALDTPIPLEALAVAAGRYAVTTLPHPACRERCVPVTLWTTPEDSAAAAAGAFRRAGEMLDWLSGRLGPFPYPGLAHVASLLPPAGRPGASVVLYDAGRVHAGEVDEREVARATAAQWLGNAVSERGPANSRPSDAAAAYLALLWSRQGGAGPMTGALPRDVDAIRALHKSVGDSIFFRGLRRYVESHRDATAEPGALERAMSEAAGRTIGWSFERAAGSAR
jgi:aminopeptidase N